MGAQHPVDRSASMSGSSSDPGDPAGLGRHLVLVDLHVARRESAMTSQVSAPPATRPTMMSHQLNSALTGAPAARRQEGASRPRITDAAAPGAVGATLRAMPILLSPLLPPLLAMIMITPDPVAFQIGPIPVYWYGVCYAVGLAATYVVITREARRRGLNARLVDNGIIIVAVAALIGGRLYHVIDQWALYKDNLLAIVLPPYSGLGVYGGILTGRSPHRDPAAAGSSRSGSGRTSSRPACSSCRPSGAGGTSSTRSCTGRPRTCRGASPSTAPTASSPYPCPTYPPDTTGFHPLFLYESISGILGAVTLLWIARRYGARMRPGDLLLIWLIWYAAVRFVLETLRTGNWTIGGIPTAMIVSALVIVGALVVLALRHRPGAADGDRWGEPPEQGRRGARTRDEPARSTAGRGRR